jgi:predicted transcriptional regulator
MDHLNEKEKEVLYQLVKHPLATSNELSKLTGLRTSSIASTKRKLKTEGYYQKVRIPLADSLGVELLSVTYTQFLATKSLGERLKIGSKYDIEHPNVFWMVSEQSQGMSLQFSPNYSAEKERIEHMELAYMKAGYLENRGIDNLLFPVRLSEFVDFFDYSHLLRKVFGIDEKNKKNSLSQKRKIKHVKLNDTEKKVLLALLAHPSFSDEKIAEENNLSRFTVLRIRKKLEGMVFKTENILNLKKIGFGLMTMFILRFSFSLSEKSIRNVLRDLRDEGAFFLVREHRECFALIPFRTFTSYRTFINTFSDRYREYQYFSSIPEILLFSLEEARFPKHHIYAPLLQSLFGMDENP